MSNVEIIELDIQPSTEVYGYFRSLSYTEGHALAEFIDNSTASFFQHEEDLKFKANQDNLQIIINYDSVTDSITIEDNAYGMNLSNFKRAVLLGKNTNETGKRNEFGFGLKTAATWFGDVWTVESTEYGSNDLFKITMDIDSLVKYKTKVKPIEKTYIDRDEHYTIITISKLNKKLNTKAIKNEIINLLGSTYRRDLKSGKVSILYNGVTLNFADYPILYFRNREWKKPLDFSFKYGDDVHNVKGFVAIMKPGGYDKTGFALFKNDRVIIGGYGENFKPKEIFSQKQSQISLKLYGELDLEDFAVTQAKDNFAWTSELREVFVQNLKNNITEFIEVANMSWTEMDKEESDNNEDLSNIEDSNDEPEIITDGYEFDDKKTDNIVNDSKNIVDEYTTSSGSDDLLVKEILFDGITYIVNWDDTSILYKYDSTNKSITLGKNNKIVSDNISNSRKLAEFILAFAFAENESNAYLDANGRVPAGLFRSNFEKFLKGIN